MKRTLLVALLAAVPVVAWAASLTLPSVTITSPASGTPVCTPTAASYTAPLAVGTVVFTCTVPPSGWTGAVSISGTQFGVTALSGNTFNVAVIGAALAAGTYQPGTVSTLP